MVNAAESDIVSPSVTTEDPLGFLSEEVFLCKDLFALVTSASFQSSYQLISCSTVGCSNSISIKPFLSCSFYICVLTVSNDILNFLFQSATDSVLSEQHTVTKLSCILEQGVGPCRTMSLLVYSVRSGR